MFPATARGPDTLAEPGQSSRWAGGVHTLAPSLSGTYTLDMSRSCSALLVAPKALQLILAASLQVLKYLSLHAAQRMKLPERSTACSSPRTSLASPLQVEALGLFEARLLGSLPLGCMLALRVGQKPKYWLVDQVYWHGRRSTASRRCQTPWPIKDVGQSTFRGCQTNGWGRV